MKSFLQLLVLCCAFTASCAERHARGLVAQILAALASKEPVAIRIGDSDRVRMLQFRDEGDSARDHETDVLSLAVSDVVRNLNSYKPYHVTVAEARELYENHTIAMSKVGRRSQLCLSISDCTDADLLRRVLSAVVPEEQDVVLIRYSGSAP